MGCVPLRPTRPHEGRRRPRVAAAPRRRSPPAGSWKPRLLPFPFRWLSGGAQDAAKGQSARHGMSHPIRGLSQQVSSGCATGGAEENTARISVTLQWHSQHIPYKLYCLPESLYLPVLGFSRLSASSEIAPVVMVFFSLETPEAAATPGLVSMSSLLALFSCNEEILWATRRLSSWIFPLSSSKCKVPGRKWTFP